MWQKCFFLLFLGYFFRVLCRPNHAGRLADQLPVNPQGFPPPLLLVACPQPCSTMSSAPTSADACLSIVHSLMCHRSGSIFPRDGSGFFSHPAVYQGSTVLVGSILILILLVSNKQYNNKNNKQ